MTALSLRELGQPDGTEGPRQEFHSRKVDFAPLYLCRSHSAPLYPRHIRLLVHFRAVRFVPLCVFDDAVSSVWDDHLCYPHQSPVHPNHPSCAFIASPPARSEESGVPPSSSYPLQFCLRDIHSSQSFLFLPSSPSASFPWPLLPL